MPVTGLDRMPGSGLARGTLFDKELNVTFINVPTITTTSTLIFEHGDANKYTITWADPSGDKSIQFRAMDATTDYFVFENATQTLTAKTLTSPAINTATIVGGTITAITDLDMTAANHTIFDTVAANTLTIGANNTTVSIPGSLTISGLTTTVDTTTLNVADNLFYMNSDFTGSATQDTGFVIERGDDTNVAFVWDESADEFAMVTTNSTGAGGDISEIAYTHLRLANLFVTQIGSGGLITVAAPIDFNNQTLTNVDINSGAIDDVTIGTNAVVTEIRVGNFNLNGNALYSTNTDGHINLIPNGTGDVQLNTETVRVGDENADATITSWGTGGIRLNTNAGTNSGHIHINSGANGNILLVTNGTGDVLLRADTVQIGDLNATANLTTRGIGDLVLDTNAGTTSGNIVIEQGTNQPITITPHGSGSVVITADTLDVSGKATNIAIIDNSATSLTIKEGSNSYLTFNTANSGGSKISLGVEIEGSNFDIDGGDIASAVVINKSPTITLTGDVTASATAMTNLGNVSLATTIAANSVALGTDTTGNYVAAITTGTGISGAVASEGATAALSIDSNQSQVTSVGALANGSIASGFGTISTGNTITTTAAVTAGSLTLNGSISTPQETNWDLLDNHATALSFDSSGKGPILTIDTRDGQEKVSMSGNLLVSGDLTVSGTTTTVESSTMTVVDPIITLQTASGGGLVRRQKM